jgi:hypothetical protein
LGLTIRHKGEYVAANVVHETSEDGPDEKTNAGEHFHHANGLLSLGRVVGRDDCEGGSGVDTGANPAEEFPQEREKDESRGFVVGYEVEET